MTKKKETAFSIFTESIGLYFSNFLQFLKYMTFPVLGQLFGLGLVLVLTLIYSKNMPYLIEKYSALDNFNTLILTAIVITLPGMAVFIKAFWEYLVAYGAVNSMLDNMLKSGKVYDFQAHTELIKRRTPAFVGLWLIFGVFSLNAAIPFFWVPAGVCAVFCVLIFQVFTYEPELSPFGCVKRSFNLIKGNFLPTFMLMAGIGALTYIAIPQLGSMLFEKTKLLEILSGCVTPLLEELPIKNMNEFLSVYGLPLININEAAKFAVTVTLTQILVQYTLPMRSILWGMWYRKLNGELPESGETKRKSKSKRPSERLIEASKKKYSTKRLDKNILKRAMEKDDEE